MSAHPSSKPGYCSCHQPGTALYLALRKISCIFSSLRLPHLRYCPCLTSPTESKLCGQDKPYGIADWVQQRREYLVKALQLSIRYRITAPIGVS